MDEPRERPDMELMLRGKPADIPAFKIQMMPPPEPERMPPPPPEPGGLVEYWRMIVRRKWLLLSVALGCTLAGFIVSIVQTPMYQARTSLEVQGPNDNFLNLRDLDPNSSSSPAAAETYVETQAHILQDEGFVEKIVTKLEADRRLEALSGPGIVARLRRAIGKEESPLAGSLHDAHILQDEGFVEKIVTKLRADRWLKALSGIVTRLRRAIGKEESPLAGSLHDAAVGRAMKNLSVHASSKSRVVDITFEAAEPRVAADFANELANELIEQSINVRLEAARRVTESLGKQLIELKSNWELSAEQLQDYARSTGLIFNADKGSTIAEEKLRQVQEDLSRAQADLAFKQAKYELAKSASPKSLPEVLDNGPLKDYQIKLTELRRQLAEMESTFTPTYFKVKNLKAQINELESITGEERKNIVDRLRNEDEAADRREKLVEQRYERESKAVSDEAARAVHYTVLKREVETNRVMYETALQKVKEAGIAAAMRASNIRVISPAKRPVHPYRPKPVFNAEMGLLAGMFLGFVLVFVRENTDRSLRAPGDIAAYLNLPELGAIPSGPTRSMQMIFRRKDWAIDVALERGGAGEAPGKRRRVNGDSKTASCGNETSPMAESFRSALASLWFAGRNEERPRVLVLTSPNAREGKTTLASNLSIALANTNRRVLLIDGDIRKPRVHTVFGIPNSWGLGDLLEDDCPIEDYIFKDIVLKTTVPGLYVMPAGTGEVNISSLRYHERLTDLLMRFRLEFHAVLLDTPPMLEFSDARVLGRLSDGVILVVRASETSRDDAAAVYRRFQEDGTPVLGSILNDWNPKKSKNGYGYRTSGTNEGR